MYDFVLMATNLLGILKQLPLDAKRKITINFLERLLKYLHGEITPKPTKDEFKALVDVIKEFKQQSAISNQEYSIIETQAEFLKQCIEWVYQNDL